MKSLLRFLSRFSVFFVFLALEIVCFMFVARFSNLQRIRLLGLTSEVVGRSHGLSDKVTSYFKLSKVNRELSQENAMLRAYIEQQKEQQELTSDTLALADMLVTDSLLINLLEVNTTDSLQQTDTLEQCQRYSFVAAKVISNSYVRQNNHFTINRGLNDGLVDEAGVIGPDGVVGIITGLSSNYGIGVSVLNKRWSVSSKVKRTNYFGTLNWDGKSPLYATLNEIPYHVQLSVGDTVVTSGYSDVFPEGIPIGTIDDVRHKSGGNFLDIKIKLSTNFENLNYVTVVINNDAQQIRQLKQEMISND